MNNLNITSIKKVAFLILAVIITACSSDILDVEPQGSVFASNYFVTADRVEESLYSTYDVLGHQKGRDLAWSPYLVISEVLSDDAYAGGQDAGDGADEDEFNRFQLGTANGIVHSIWTRNYTGLYRANFTIEKAEALENVTDEVRAQLIAEAKFLRAYFNFELVRFFENIVLLDFTPTSADDVKIPQSGPGEVYNFIASDLVDAIENLPDSYPSSETGRATRWAAKALLGRVHLFEQGVYGVGMSADGTAITDSYVLTQLEDVINNSGHDLEANFADIFLSSAEFGIESVFEISYAGLPVGGDWGTEQYVEGNLAAQMMGPRITNSSTYYRGWAFAIPTHKLFLDMNGDPRRDATILQQAQLQAEPGITLNTGSYQYTGYYNAKYTTRLADRGTVGTPELHNMSNYRAIRFADVLLMAAEIGNNVAYINRVRQRVGLADLPAYTEDALFNERRMELSGEGLRYWDLLRRGQTVAAQELTISGVIGPNYSGPNEVYETSFNSATRGFIPIPQTEIDLSNGVLTQNDGY
ncbi:RagB/SusD family nutrient uptake outer membrane protein [Ekhidna sp.]|uniref:RagB/SusD family nutrient uptake outer membrane protein n=1 Tax=Ekhidna sp. TaxID=2608089 RepID=UPI003BAA2920